MPRFDGTLMRARRKQLGLSAPDLADLSKVPYATVLRFETGKQRPAADQWIAETLATAPPMTERQAARLSAILFSRAS